MGSVKSKEIIPPDGEEGKIYRVREVSTICGCGMSADEKGRVSHCWPLFCQSWNSNTRSRCLPCMRIKQGMTPPDEQVYEMYTPVSYYHEDGPRESDDRFGCGLCGLCVTKRKEGKEFTCAACFGKSENGWCSPCCAVLDDVTFCGSEKTSCCHVFGVFGGWRTRNASETCWCPGAVCHDDYCAVPGLICDTREPYRPFKNAGRDCCCDGCCCCCCLFNELRFPKNCCLLGFGATRDYYVTPLGCMSKESSEFCSVCGWNGQNGGCLLLPCAKLHATHDGKEYTDERKLNEDIEEYNRAHPNEPLVEQKITHFSGCINGEFPHDATWLKAKNMEDARQIVAQWFRDNPVRDDGERSYQNGTYAPPSAPPHDMPPMMSME